MFVYHPILSVMDSYNWYITRFCLSWTILVGISTGFVCLKMVGISTSFVCHEQQWLVYLPVCLS